MPGLYDNDLPWICLKAAPVGVECIVVLYVAGIYVSWKHIGRMADRSDDWQQQYMGQMWNRGWE
uniref:Uncharacterized protein n=1 Tax=Cucumis melo TaxID=3656 RepID=A0A9I9EFF5_CUCME